MKKICSGCKQSKSLNAFAKKAASRYGRQARCRECHSKYTRKHYQENKEFYKNKAKRNDAKYIARAQKIIDSYRRKPCTDCKLTYPLCVMEFDHVSDDKLYNVSDMKVYSIKTLMREIAKCEIVCANCHRIRTHSRRRLNK